MLNRFILLLLFVYAIPANGMIYDCFMFFNEWDILEIRLNELYEHVDKFVIVESCESFRGLPKAFNFERFKEIYPDRFAKFLDKIVYVKIDDRIGGTNDWIRENYQKNQIMRALMNCKPDDLILISDVDEIPPAQMIFKAEEVMKDPQAPIIVFHQNMYRFYINRLAPDVNGLWFGTLAMRYDRINQQWLPNQHRTAICFEGSRQNVVEWEGGWHFTSMGGFERFCEKCNNWLHWRNPYEDTQEAFDELSGSYPLVPIDETYPLFVQENIPYLIDIGLIDTRE